MSDNRHNHQRCTCGNYNTAQNGFNLKEKLRAIDFAIVDTALYLDVYPDCQKALEHYHMLIAEREKLAEAINCKYGPITIKENKSRTKWEWVRGPWPWEPDAN